MVRSSLPNTPDSIVHTLRAEIQSGTLVPGSPLRQEDLAARFGVSRIPVRDALSKLEGEGLVHIYPNQGAFVSRLSAKEILELYEMRILLEVELLSKAWPRLQGAPLEDARVALLDMEATEHLERWSVLDAEFHWTLYQPARKAKWLEQIEKLRLQTNRFYFLSQPIRADLRSCEADHRVLLEACQEQHMDVALETLQLHLEAAAKVVSQHLNTK